MDKMPKITTDIVGEVRRVCHGHARSGAGSALLPLDQCPQRAVVLHLGDPVRQQVVPDQTQQP